MVEPCLVRFVYSCHMHANSCCYFYANCKFFLFNVFRLYKSIRTCINCLFVIYVVFILSGMPINQPHSLFEHYFLIGSVDNTFVLDRFPDFLREQIDHWYSHFQILECSIIKLLSYSSACYSNLDLLNVFLYLYIYLCGSFSCMFYYFYFLILC